ncbi:MAG: HD domain-containing protein [Bdellovibrionota bacterium]
MKTIPVWLEPKKRTDNSDCLKEIKKFENKPYRHPFDRDYGIIAHSSKFRRLSGKTQVFLSPKSDFPRTRLTHSVEAAQIGRELAVIFRNHFEDIYSSHELGPVGSFERLVETSCLAHDIGHPPFGHCGAKTLEKLCGKNDYEFDDNKHVVHYFLHNLPVTNVLLDTVIKDKKDGWYTEDEDACEKIFEEHETIGVRHPVTYLMEAADDLVNFSSDLEDAKNMNILQDKDFECLVSPIIGTLKAASSKDKVSQVIKCSIEHIEKSIEKGLKHCFDKDHDPDSLPKLFQEWIEMESVIKEKKDKTKLNIFSLDEKFSVIYEKKLYFDESFGILKHKAIFQPEMYAEKIIESLWSKLFSLGSERKENLPKNPIFILLPKDKQKWLQDNLDNVQNNTKKKSMHVSRYIAGMTDEYCVYLYEQIHKPLSVLYRDSLIV